ncbi:MAG: sigma-54 dependent transcriptional regulator [Burkholderiales bacterium]|jgi:sigma-54 specific flagellar transcriptional regulator A|nr:sigma-54 dependent transcriptional regulator [Burkholderiales bacterium]
MAANTPQFIGDSDAVRAIRGLLPVVALSSSTVLITGESGTGKEIVARSLHDMSGRSAGNFVPINCAAIPKDLIESELFGHSKGAFTGAATDRKGRFELAHNGSIFLDEIGDLSLELQVKLLRVLQERVVDPVGGAKPVSINVRVIAATHRDLEAEILAGRFREDLYYRLNVLPISTPPLREREADVPLLLNFFAQRFMAEGEKPVSFSPDFMQALRAYSWPGNVRELSNLVDRFSTLFAGQRLSLRSLPAALLPKGLAALQLLANEGGLGDEDEAPVPDAPSWENSPVADGVVGEVSSQAYDESNASALEQMTFLSEGLAVLPPEGLSLKNRLAEIERDLISQALSRTKGNVSQTARILNLQRTTLIEKIQKFGLRAN